MIDLAVLKKQLNLFKVANEARDLAVAKLVTKYGANVSLDALAKLADEVYSANELKKEDTMSILPTNEKG